MAHSIKADLFDLAESNICPTDIRYKQNEGTIALDKKADFKDRILLNKIKIFTNLHQPGLSPPNQHYRFQQPNYDHGLPPSKPKFKLY